MQGMADLPDAVHLNFYLPVTARARLVHSYKRKLY